MLTWQFVLALCAGVGFVILALKNPEKAGEVLTHAADAFKEYAVAETAN